MIGHLAFGNRPVQFGKFHGANKARLELAKTPFEDLLKNLQETDEALRSFRVSRGHSDPNVTIRGNDAFNREQRQLREKFDLVSEMVILKMNEYNLPGTHMQNGMRLIENLHNTLSEANNDAYIRLIARKMA